MDASKKHPLKRYRNHAAPGSRLVRNVGNLGVANELELGGFVRLHFNRNCGARFITVNTSQIVNVANRFIPTRMISI